MKRVVSRIALVLIVLICPVLAQNEQFSSIGTGLGSNESEALMNAKRDAIEKGIGQVLLSQTEIENFMVKRDQIVTKTMGAVKSYDIISQSKTSDNLIEMKIKAVISKTAMREDLAAFHILIESMDKPRVMVIVNENNVGTMEPTNRAAETAILQFLKTPYDFDLIDPNVTATIKSSQQKMANLSGNAAEAAAIGSQYGAEVIIVGDAVSREAKHLSQNLGGMISVQADVTLKAINCATARIIGSSSGHGAKVHIAPNTAGNNAIAQGAKKAMKELLDAIISEWQNQLNNGIPITVAIKGVKTFRQKKAVVQTLGGLGNVSAVRERNWNGQSGLLQLDVQYKGNVDGFCTKVDGYKLTVGGSLAVTGVNGSSVTLATGSM